ncbi:MAG TPA: YciI family protein [Telluria sp.]|jgi:hypothetical protein
MQYMILRRADRQSEAGRLAPREDSLLFASLQPSTRSVRLRLREGEPATVTQGPFPDPAEMIAGFAIVDVPGKEAAVDWLRAWPAGEHPVELEIRESGCPGGCAQVIPAEVPGMASHKRFAVLLRSSDDLENETPVPQAMLDALDVHNAAQARQGVLLAADGLRSSARGARVKVAKNSFSVIDGPFTEIKEMIAGFWLIRVPSMHDAIEWAKRNPYPVGPDVDVEIRELFDSAATAQFSPDQQAAEQRMRAEQLEAGMRAHFTA